LAIWILIPQNEGEKVMYLILSSYFTQFEQKITWIRNAFFEIVLKVVLNLAFHTSDYCRTRVSPEKLVDMRKVSERTDNALYQQMKIFGVLESTRSSTKSSSSSTKMDEPQDKVPTRSYA